MKQTGILSLILMLVSQVALAQDLPEIRKSLFESYNICGQAVFSDSKWFVASSPNSVNGIGHIRLQSLTDSNRRLDLPASDTVVDVKIQDGNVYILTETTFEAWNIATPRQLFVYRTHPQVTKTSHWANKSTGFVLHRDVAVIANGPLGFSVLRLKSGVIQKFVPMPTRSSAQDITLLDENTAVVAVDNNGEREFRGIYLLDLNSLEVSNQIKIDNAMPLSVRVLPNNRLIMGYINGFWKFDLQMALSKAEALPNRRTWVFPGFADSDLTGKLYFDEKYVYGCTRILYTGIYNDLHPFVVSLDELKLN